MSRRQYSRLCYLIHDSQHLFTTAKSTELITKEQEKSLLIILSQVLNQIKVWIGEFDSDSGSGSGSGSGSDSDNGDHGNPSIDVSSNGEFVIRNSICHSSTSQCIFKITNDLVFLLAVESSYARHLAGNVLVAISEFVVASESYWEEFLQSLFFFFEVIICKAVSPSFDPPKITNHLDCDSSSFKLDLQSLSSNARWYSVGSIVLVLRNILKQQKHEEDDDENLEVFLNALGSCLRNIPWDFIDNVDEVSVSFCGYLVQLFCSVVSRISSSEAMADSVGENAAIQEIFNIFPKILAWCLGKPGECRNHTGISRYVRHKILVLMIRLSSLIHLHCNMITSWLHLIDKYFQDPLLESVTQPQADQDDCLQDSPFLPSLDDVEHDNGSHRHLKRRVVFLYLKCAFRLIGLKERPEKQCLCGDVKSCSKKGFAAVYEWLEMQLPDDIFVNSELYNDRCKRFTKCFLQLYMHEDDMLFEVLLQLTNMPFGCEQRIAEEWTSEVVEKNVLLLLSDIFDPVHLFHLFLSELHYDHEVLLDYLISKDTGASCAEYLLKCLRIVCDTWNSFRGFPVRKGGNRSSFKRRKVMNDSCVQQESSSESSSDEIRLSSKTGCKNQERRFHAATDCLLLLKKSVENLHQKNLFPYNPEVLLRRLTRFQELCQNPDY
ncbi:hypothetical protein L6452_44367 [Arctium lappa]|uniref:Uncharacterized protein n=1 Tax=Arctium lappa TaxID=4217 RepID=A0ACB8XEW8_ARCLA|nr:hypothetical protein L6452_44367 [Arctium lappa]